MNLMDNIGISYNANYLVQGNQIERCKTSSQLNVKNTELKIRTDGKDSNIDSLSKIYNGNIVFHLPSVNPDLSNLKLVNDLVKNLKEHKINLVSINASNLSSDLFEWSTIDEQKQYFLNVVTSIATLASNKIQVAIENSKSNDLDSTFGSNISQITDIVIYSRKLLVKDFGFKEEEAEEYIGISLNVDNIDINDSNESIQNYFEVFNKSIKLIKISDLSNIDVVIDTIIDKNYDIPLFMQTSSELEEIKNEYDKLIDIILKKAGKKGLTIEKPTAEKPKNISTIIIIIMIVLTIAIIALMFILKLK